MSNYYPRKVARSAASAARREAGALRMRRHRERKELLDQALAAGHPLAVAAQAAYQEWQAAISLDRVGDEAAAYRHARAVALQALKAAK